MKHLYYILFLVYFNALSYAQNLVNIKGKVLDSEEKTGLPYAHIFLEGTSLGTSTDVEGNFHLQVPLNYNKVDSLVISFVGYHTQQIALKSIQNRSNLEIYLKPYTEELEGVTISSNYTVIDLLKEALDKRKENYYEEKPIYLKGYFYENAYSQHQEKEVRKLEAYLTTYRPQINSHKLPKIAVDKARQKMDKEYANFAMGSTSILLGNLDREHLLFELSAKSLKAKNITYKMQGLRTIDNRINYYIVVEKENKERNMKRLTEIYIDTSTLAFSRINIQSIAKDKKGSVVKGSVKFNKLYRVSRYNSVTKYNYNKSTQKWYLKSYDGHGVFIQKTKNEDILHLYSKYIINKIERDNIKILAPHKCLSLSFAPFSNHIQSFAKKWNSPLWNKD